MASDDFLNRDNFGLLPEPRDRMASFGISTIVNLVIASILLLLTMNKIKQAETNHYYSTQLIFPVKQPKFKVPRPPAKILRHLSNELLRDHSVVGTPRGTM